MSDTLTYSVDADITKIQNKIQTLDKNITNLGKKGSKVNLGSSQTVKAAGDVQSVADKLKGAALISKNGLASLSGGISSLASTASKAHPAIAILVAAIAGIAIGIKKAVSGIENAEVGESLANNLKRYTLYDDEIDKTARFGERYNVDEESLMEPWQQFAHKLSTTDNVGSMMETAYLASGLNKELYNQLVQTYEVIYSGGSIDSGTVKRYQKRGIDLIDGVSKVLKISKEQAETLVKNGELKGDFGKETFNAVLALEAGNKADYNKQEMAKLENQLGNLSKTWSNGIDDMWLAFRDGFNDLSWEQNIATLETIVRDVIELLKRLFSIVGAVCGAITTIFTAIAKGIRFVVSSIANVVLSIIEDVIDALPDFLQGKFTKGLKADVQDWKRKINGEDKQTADNVAKNAIKNGDKSAENARQLANQPKELSEEEKQKERLTEIQKKHNERIERYDLEIAALHENYSGEELKFMQRELENKKTYSANWTKFYQDSYKKSIEAGLNNEQANELAVITAKRKADILQSPLNASLEADRAAYKEREELAARTREKEQEIINLRLRGENILADKIQNELEKEKQISDLVKNGRSKEEAETLYNTQKKLDDTEFIANYEREATLQELRANGLNEQADAMERQAAIQADVNKLIQHGMTEIEARTLAEKKNMSINESANKSISQFQNKWGQFLKQISGWQKDEIYRAGGGYNNSKVNTYDLTKSYQNGMKSIATKQQEITARIEGYLSPNGWIASRLEKMGGAVYA